MHSIRTKLRSPGAVAYTVLVVVWLVYAGLSLLAPVNKSLERYHISVHQYHLLRATIYLPLLFIWWAVLFGALRFNRYAQMVAGTPEGQGFKKIALGLWVLLASIIVPSFVAFIASFNPDSVIVEKYVAITRNYLTVILYLVAFWQILQAARVLSGSVEGGGLTAQRARPMVIAVLVLLSAVYVGLVFNNEFRTFSNDPIIKPVYYLPDLLILLTVIIPYIFAWLWGSLAVLHIAVFARKVPGTIYRKAFRSVACGLVIITVFLIMVQLISQARGFFSQASLPIVLGIIYILLIVIGIGYVSIARGARALATIEKV